VTSRTETPATATAANAASRGALGSRSRRATAYLLLAIVMGAVAAMSWAGLYGFARVTMHWSPAHAALVPIALDVAALSCAFLALDSLSRNDSATSFRILTAALVALSAFVNWRHSLASHNIAEQVFFPAMSILSYAMIDAVLRKYRRDTRNDRAGRPAREVLEPLPRVGILAALVHPSRVWAATSAALARRVPDAEAFAETLSETRQRDVSAGYLLGLSQADAIRKALEIVGDDDPRQVVAWLTQNGRPVQPQRVYDVIRRDGRGRHAALRLAPVAGQLEGSEADAS
jgi:Protein of unknown function (DUF2637)